MRHFWRQYDIAVCSGIQNAMIEHGINYIDVLNEYIETGHAFVPSIAFGKKRRTELQLELGSDVVIGKYFYELNIYARSENELSSIIDVICNFFSSKDLFIKDNRAFIHHDRILASEEKNDIYLSKSIKYYKIDFDGHSSFGTIDNSVLFDKDKLCVDLDVSINSLYSYNNFVQIPILSDPMDAYISTSTIASPKIYYVFSGATSMPVGYNFTTNAEYKSFLVFATSGYDLVDEISGFNLYFYASPSVYLYSGEVYIITGYSVPITTGFWDYGNLIGTFTPTGWCTLNIDRSLIDTNGYTIFKLIGTNPLLKRVAYVRAYEYGSSFIGYLDPIYTVTGYFYDEHYLLDKFDENNWDGFKLYYDSGGNLEWSVGFSGVKLTNIGLGVLESGQRYHITASYEFTSGLRYDSKLFINDELVDSSYVTWNRRPAWNNLDLLIGAGIEDDVSQLKTNYADVSLYSLRVNETKYLTQPIKYGENLTLDGTEIVYFKIEEGLGSKAYDFIGTTNMLISGDYTWNNYITKRSPSSRICTAKIEILLKVLEDLEDV